MNLYRPTKHLYNFIITGFDQLYNMRANRFITFSPHVNSGCVKIYRKTKIIMNTFTFCPCAPCVRTFWNRLETVSSFPHTPDSKVAKKLCCKAWLMCRTIPAVHPDHVLLTMMVDASWGKSELEQRFWPVEQSLQTLWGNLWDFFRHWSTLKCVEKRNSLRISFSLQAVPKVNHYPALLNGENKTWNMVRSTMNSAIKV